MQEYKAPELEKSYTEGDWKIGQATFAKIGKALESLKTMAPEKDRERIEKLVSEASHPITTKIDLTIFSNWGREFRY